jgi:hypothetical protein
MANAEYWRVHEAEYRAMARSCSNKDARHNRTVLAERCAAMAAQESALDEVELAPAHAARLKARTGSSFS